jgi:hypothetical protein
MRGQHNLARQKKKKKMNFTTKALRHLVKEVIYFLGAGGHTASWHYLQNYW